MIGSCCLEKRLCCLVSCAVPCRFVCCVVPLLLSTTATLSTKIKIFNAHFEDQDSNQSPTLALAHVAHPHAPLSPASDEPVCW